MTSNNFKSSTSPSFLSNTPFISSRGIRSQNISRSSRLIVISIINRSFKINNNTRNTPNKAFNTDGEYAAGYFCRYAARLTINKGSRMGHKVLKDHAFVFCQMFMGCRMASDLETFAKLPDGELQIDILAATCNHSKSGPVDTYIAGEIRAWFIHRLEQHDVSVGDVTSATLTVKMKNTIPSKHKMGITYDWVCDGRITTADREYSAHLAEPHTWTSMFSTRNS